MIIKKCLYCNKEFKVLPYRQETAKYCSHKCHSLAAKGKPGKPISEKHKKILSELRKINNPMWNPESKRKMIEKLKGRHNSPHTEFKKGNTGEKCINWKGGKIKHEGYWFIYRPGHPKAYHSNKKYVKRAVLVVEKHLDRFLTKEETIHHINGIKDDDRPENLYIFPNWNSHNRFEKLKNKPILKSNVIKR